MGSAGAVIANRTTWGLRLCQSPGSSTPNPAPAAATYTRPICRQPQRLGGAEDRAPVRVADVRHRDVAAGAVDDAVDLVAERDESRRHLDREPRVGRLRERHHHVVVVRERPARGT